MLFKQELAEPTLVAICTGCSSERGERREEGGMQLHTARTHTHIHTQVVEASHAMQCHLRNLHLFVSFI